MSLSEIEKDFCFCTLALGAKYRNLAKELAGDLEKYSPGTKLVIGTEQPEEFREQQNVIAFKHQQQGILHCYHDRRFVIEKALSMFRVVINIDADTRLSANVPEPIEVPPGISGRDENLVQHIKKNRPQDMELIKTVADKLKIPWENANWIGESLFIIVRDDGKEMEFIKLWGKIASYLELKGIHSGDGNVMGLAAAKVGLSIKKNDYWEQLHKIREHLDASYKKNQTTAWDNLKRRLGYHYRLNKARILALKDINFYYR